PSSGSFEIGDFSRQAHRSFVHPFKRINSSDKKQYSLVDIRSGDSQTFDESLRPSESFRCGFLEHRPTCLKVANANPAMENRVLQLERTRIINYLEISTGIRLPGLMTKSFLDCRSKTNTMFRLEYIITIIIGSMTSVFNIDASLPYNHDLFESLIVKKKNKDGRGGDLLLPYYNHSENKTDNSKGLIDCSTTLKKVVRIAVFQPIFCVKSSRVENSRRSRSMVWDFRHKLWLVESHRITRGTRELHGRKLPKTTKLKGERPQRNTDWERTNRKRASNTQKQPSNQLVEYDAYRQQGYADQEWANNTAAMANWYTPIGQSHEWILDTLRKLYNCS
ncbi:hypothetical protein CLF_102687, partial [Clonorchis sinensis]